MILKQAFANHWKFEGRDIDGTLLWVEEFDNLITTEGLIDILNKYLQGVSYSAAWFVGLIDNASFTALAEGDTAAQINGTNGWKESVAYSQATRPALTLGTTTGSGATATVDNTASPATYTMTAPTTINGGFLVNVSPKASTAGHIYGEGSFSGTQTLTTGQTLTITVTCTAASA